MNSLKLLVVFAAIACVALSNSSGKCGTCSYVLDYGVLTISGYSCKMASYTTATLSEIPWLEDRATIHTILVSSGVKEIGDYCFIGCGNLINLTIADTVEEIGEHAFSDCTSLKYANLTMRKMDDIKDYAFSGCSSLETVLFPGIEKIKEYVFLDCVNLKDIEIESGVKKIQKNAFQGCSNLESIHLPSTLAEIDNDAFLNCVSLKQVIYSGLVNPGLDTTKNPFNNCPELSLICVRKAYLSDKFCNRTTYQSSTSAELKPLLDSQNACYEAYICNETYGVLAERANATAWNNGVGDVCGLPYCNNETGAAYVSMCNSTNVCYTSGFNYCYDRDYLASRGWSVVLSFSNVSVSRFNKTVMSSAIYNISKISSNAYASEISDDGYLLSFYYIVSYNTTAESVANLLESTLKKDTCKKLYGLVCEADNITIVEGPEYESAYTNYVSVFVLLLALVISTVSF